MTHLLSDLNGVIISSRLEHGSNMTLHIMRAVNGLQVRALLQVTGLYSWSMMTEA